MLVCYIQGSLGLVIDLEIPIMTSEPLLWVAAAVLLLGFGLRVWVAQEGSSTRQRKGRKWLWPFVIASAILALFIYLLVVD